MTRDKSIVYRIGAVLSEKGIDQQVLADLMKVQKATVSRWVNNQVQPKPENLLRIAELTKTNLRDLHVSTDSWPVGPSEAEIAQAAYDKKKADLKSSKK